MAEDGDCPENTIHGLAGDRIFIQNGKMVAEANRDQLFPRTAIALDAAKETMWLAVVDGRQAGYSEGVTLAELAEELIAKGADQALNLDGGGSVLKIWIGFNQLVQRLESAPDIIAFADLQLYFAIKRGSLLIGRRVLLADQLL